MNILIAILTSLSLILLGAHHLRFGEPGLTAAMLVLAALFLARKAWVRIPVLFTLFWGAWTWADATYGFVRMRILMGADWERLVVIMGAVMLVTLAAVLLNIAPAQAGWYRKSTENARARGAVFVLTCIGLGIASAKVSFPVLLLERFAPGWGWLEIILLAIYAQWVVNMMLDRTKQPKVRRRIWAGFSAVFFLQLLMGLLGVDRMLMTGELHLPVPALIAAGPVFRGEGFFMPILFGVTLILVGPAWCSHLCYIGAWDDSASRMGARRPANLGRRTVLLTRVASLVLVVAAAYAMRLTGVSWVTAAWSAAIFVMVGVIIMATVSRRMGTMVHCTTFCPMGVVANVLGKISPWRIRIGRDCTGCNVCFSRCRYSALDARALQEGRPSLSCTLCGDCVGACRHGQLEYAFPGLTAEAARVAFLVMVVGLHAVFLGVARI
jgi:Pyruvate/2-oxoacid:ferredoxin oxidoreductase delta subunit